MIKMIFPLFGFILYAWCNLLNASQVVTQEALNIYKIGYDCLKPLLDCEERKLYLDDENYLVSFPFISYPIIDVPEQGKFYVDTIDDCIKNNLRACVPWEENIRRLIHQYIVPGTTAIDIGAHIGTHTISMSKYVGPLGRVFSFEPSKKIHREQCMNLALNQCKNVYPMRCALGKGKGIIGVFSSHPNNEGGSYVLEKQNGENSAVILALDEFQLTNVSFIKMDVENMEADVLDGAIQTIVKNSPIMLIEIQGNLQRPLLLGENSQQMKYESIIKIINLGYRLERIGLTDDYLAFPE